MAIVAAFVTAGCATDPRIEGPLAGRPLIAPPDTGTFTFGAGASFPKGGPEPAFELDLEVGLTDGLSLQLPLLLRVGGSVSDTWSVGVVGGLTSIGIGAGSLVVEVPDDPRLPADAVYPTGLAFGGGPIARWKALPDVALSLSAVASAYFHGFSHVSLRVGGSASLTKSFGRWVSIHAGISYSLIGEPTTIGELYAQEASGGGALGLHFDGFDIHLAGGSRITPGPPTPTLRLGFTHLF